MRQGQHKNRSRNRSRRPSSPLSRVFESNGPDVKVRGTAQHVADKYLQLARDAQSSGDVIMAENYYQHAEHYLRILAAANSYAQQSGQQTQSQFHNRRPEGDDEGYDDSDEPTAPGEDDQPVVMTPAGQAPVQGRSEEQPHPTPAEDGEPVDKTWGGPQPEFLRRGSNGAAGRPPRRPRPTRGGQGQAEPAGSPQPGAAEPEQPVREVTD